MKKFTEVSYRYNFIKKQKKKPLLKGKASYIPYLRPALL